MAGTRSAKAGRLAAVAAADRIKKLLDLVDGDDFLHEILSTANQMVQDSMQGQSSISARPTGGTSHHLGTTGVSILDNDYHEAKKKSLEGLDLARIRLN